MAARKRSAGHRSTPVLAFWGVAMLLLGLGLGLFLSNQGCKKKTPPPKETHEPRRPETTHKPKAREGSAVAAPATGKATAKPNDQVSSGPTLPRLALVIDDFGYAPPELVRRLCAQPVPFAAAILPYQEFTQESATIAHGAGKEIMLHLPMEPVGYPGPGKDPGPDAVMFALPEAEMRARVRKALLDVPWRKGVNNHMGSRITPDRTRMTWILQEIKAAHCFFLDSRTEKESVAYDVAVELKIPAAQRKVFLDDDKAFEAMEKQWLRALNLARAEGHVIIIGHIYPETVEALEKLIPRSQGQVTFVKVSELTR